MTGLVSDNLGDFDESVNSNSISEPLLAWYDDHARDLPWRAHPANRAPGHKIDPYHVWLSEIMLQQTTVAAVISYFQRFTSLWPDIHALANAHDDDVMATWAGLGYYARARNLLATARIVSREMGGAFPQKLDALMKLPGIGPYTAAAIRSIAFDKPANVVDGNVERVMARLFNVEEPLETAKPKLKSLAGELVPETRPGDYAQALMDLGATICKPTPANCPACPLNMSCLARQEGSPERLPLRLPKKPKPVRRGFAYVCRTESGGWILERRPDKGLLGGTLGWPGSVWCEAPRDKPPFGAGWQNATEHVRHTFTHFHLLLEIRVARLQDDAFPDGMIAIPHKEFRRDALPSLMRKVFDIAAPHEIFT